jgi:uncharacterized protein YbcI
MPGLQGENGQLASAAGTAITRLHREHYGRGATTTRVVYQRNFLIVFLEDIYTPVERTLIDAGQRDTVRQTRQAFQDAMTDKFSAAIEQVTGRKVIAFLSQVHFDPDLATETFILDPSEEDKAATLSEAQ